MELKLELTDRALEKDRVSIFDPLIKYNSHKVGDPSHRPLNVIIRDPSTGTPLGGLWGCTAYGWLSIELLYIPENQRGNGLGKTIIQNAEAEASHRGCHSARVDTHEFQGALGFYNNCGYEIYGEIPDYPTGYARYFLQKQIL